MAKFSDLFVAGFYAEGSRETIVAAIQKAGQDAAKQNAVRDEVRRGVFAKAFCVNALATTGLPTVASVNATDAILAKTPSQLTEEEKVVHARFRKAWSRYLEAANVASTDPRAAGNKDKNAGKKKPGAKVTAANEEKKVETAPIVAAPIVAAPIATSDVDVEAYALQMATTFHHYVNKNAKAFKGAKGAAFAEAFRQFTRAARAAALIKEEGEMTVAEAREIAERKAKTQAQMKALGEKRPASLAAADAIALT